MGPSSQKSKIMKKKIQKQKPKTKPKTKPKPKSKSKSKSTSKLEEKQEEKLEEKQEEKPEPREKQEYISHSIGNHLKIMEMDNSRVTVLINNKVMDYVLIYNKPNNIWKCKEY